MHDSFIPAFISQQTLFAQEAAPPIAGPGGSPAGAPGESAPGSGVGGGGARPQAAPFGGNGFFIWLILMMFVFMIVMQVFSGRKDKKRRAEMLSGVARHDRVQTVGGMLGTVSEIKGDEIVLKIDEATNTKVRIVRSAIQQVLKKSGDTTEADATAIGKTQEKIAS